LEGEYFWVDMNKVPALEKMFKPSLEVVVSEIQNREAGEKSWSDQFIS